MTKQELLIVSIITIYSLIIVIGIHRYESRIKNLNAEIEWLYDKVFKNKPSNAQHYTQIQLENADLRNVTKDLDEANKLLQEQIKQLKVSLVESPLQYESDMWKGPLTEL
jgi:hypothetical protein